MLNLSPLDLIEAVIIILVSLTVHEFGHSLAAIRLGDDTPRREGRLTLNPLAHIDLVGFILLVVAGFGWAKPVHINPQALRKPRRDEILISIAGPAANLVLAVAVAVLVRIILPAAAAARGSVSPQLVIGAFGFLTQAVAINVSLALFNMLPIPPLDGSHLITTWLRSIDMHLAALYFRYGSFALLAVVVLQWITKIQILPIGRWTMSLVLALYSLLGIR